MAARHSPESPLQTVHERNFALRASECGRFSLADRFGGRGLDDCPACWACRVVLVLLVVLAATALVAAAGPGGAPPATYADCLAPPFLDGRICLSPGPAWVEWVLWGEIGAIAVFGLICAICCAFPRPPRHRGANRHRPIDPGSAEAIIEIGDEGLQIRSHRRRLVLHWTAFDADKLFGEDPTFREALPAAADPAVSGIADAPVRLDDFLSELPEYADPQHPLGQFRQAVRAWVKPARSERARLVLPLRADPKAESNPGGRRDANWLEHVTIPRRFFTGASSEIDWPDFVTACAYMIRLANPRR